MDKDNFLKAINSLKLYRRAELLDDSGKSLINKLYVDPFPNEHVLKTVIKPNTTYLIGRKGTGKSTIFLKAQEELDKDKQVTWAYIDIKTLFESSTSEIVGDIPDKYKNVLSPTNIRKIILFKNFLIELITEIRKQIDARITSSVWNQFKEAFTGSSLELFEKLDSFISDIEQNEFLNVTGIVEKDNSQEDKTKDTGTFKATANTKLNATPSIDIGIVAELLSEIEKRKSQNYSEVFLRIFNIKQLIQRLKEILNLLKLRSIYVFIDDFSELPPNDMAEVVDTLLAPFNNWSEEFIKLKIAVYPGRVYFGTIDRSKIDEVYLDIFHAYGRQDVNALEEQAIDFTRRLIEKRIEIYCNSQNDNYFEKWSPDLWRVLFFSCLGNPRILGYILYYSYELNIIYDKKIGVRAIQDSSIRYFDEKIEQNFKLNRFLHESFEEKSSIYSLKELFEEILSRAKELRTYGGSKIIKSIIGRPPTSHFHVLTEYDAILSTLELNFFLTKYYEMKNRGGKEVSVYAINYGLCQKEAITFGRPTGKKEFRLYFIERIFDFNHIITSYLKLNQEVVCQECGAKHEFSKLQAIQEFGMLCLTCRQGTCKIINLSRKYEDLINSVAEDSLLPKVELGILKTLHDERKAMFAKEIASELDCSYQLIGKRGKILSDRDLIGRAENTQGRRTFSIKDKTEKIYFTED